MHIWALILAAGRGVRLASHGVPKQFLLFKGAPLFWHAASTLSRLPALRGFVFVFPPGEAADPARDGEAWLRRLDGGGALGLPWRTACGGARRQDSVAAGLAALPEECDAVLVHDSARPFVSAGLATRVATALEQGLPAVIPGIAVTDTIKAVDASERVLCTHERSSLRAVQTPQGFDLASLRAAHARAAASGWDVTDDAALMERCGVSVLVVEGEADNRKITTPDDLRLLRHAAFGARQEDAFMQTTLPCSGIGYDVHRYGGDRPFILGGVPIRCGVTLAAHSDGDVLLHALMDALLGCIGGGDIGALFPDSDPAFANIASGVLLSEVLERTRRAGLRLVHVDSVIVAQTPKIAPHREAIAANLAKLLELPRSAVNVKATTEEGLGFTGEKKGIKALVVVSALKGGGGEAALLAGPGTDRAGGAGPQGEDG